MYSSIALLSLISSALALKVTSPDKSDVWTVGKSQTIKWESVNTDQSSFNVYLSNMASYPSQNILLASDISSSKGSLTIDGSALVAGNSFTINFTNGTKTEQIYAQSNQFNITQGSTSSSSASDSTSTSASASTLSTATATGSSSKTSGTAAATKSSASSASGSSSSNANSTAGSASSTGTASGSSASGSSTSTVKSGAGKTVAKIALPLALAALAL